MDCGGFRRVYDKKIDLGAALLAIDTNDFELN